MTSTDASAPRSIRAGRVLGGRYTLVSRIAKGGMGEVWRVRDQRTGMLVAAKVLRPELRGEEISLSRLRLEAKNTVRARHPNIASVLDSGEDEGQGWIVMELIDGRPLTEFVGDGKRLAAQQLIPILTQTAYALDASAQAGVVHRDIKPANIMIRKDGMVKLTDFGISFAQGQANLTAVGMVMGTAQYLAPEQAMGAEATTAGDLYSLGIIAYEALAGRRPFTGKSPVEIAMSHVKDEIPALPDDVPEGLAQVVFGLLAKDPSERPPSGAALVRTLSRVASSIGATTGPLPLPAPPTSEGTQGGLSQPRTPATQTPSDGSQGPRGAAAPVPGGWTVTAGPSAQRGPVSGTAGGEAGKSQGSGSQATHARGATAEHSSADRRLGGDASWAGSTGSAGREQQVPGGARGVQPRSSDPASDALAGGGRSPQNPARRVADGGPAAEAVGASTARQQSKWTSGDGLSERRAAPSRSRLASSESATDRDALANWNLPDEDTLGRSQRWRPVKGGSVVGARPSKTAAQPVLPRSSAGLPSRTRGGTSPSPEAAQSKMGAWVIYALVALTVVLIVIAMIRDHAGATPAAAALIPNMVSTTEVPTWWNLAPDC